MEDKSFEADWGVKKPYMGHRLNYIQVRDLLALYANELLPKFADRFSRWPVGHNAVMLVQEIQAKVEMWYGINRGVAIMLADVAGEIIVRADTSH